MKHLHFLILGIIMVLSACKSEQDVPLDKIDLSLDIERVDLSLRDAAHFVERDTLFSDTTVYRKFLAKHKSFLVEWFFPGVPTDSVPDSVMAIILVRDFVNYKPVMQLLDSVATHFPEDYDFENIFLNPFKRFTYYFPEKEVPKIRTFVTGYSQSGQAGTDEVTITPHYLGLGLHYYLGKSFPFYPQDLPQYIRRRFEPSYMASLVFKQTAYQMLPELSPISNPRLLDKMVRAGIRLYFLDAILPEAHDSLKIFYTKEQLYWSYYYEDRIYAEILPKLYSTDLNDHNQFLSEAPFTTGLIRESAPRIGEFCGWMIVHNYMTNNQDVTLADLFAETDYEKILKGARYRPKSK